jgi:inosose dehydratase
MYRIPDIEARIHAVWSDPIRIGDSPDPLRHATMRRTPATSHNRDPDWSKTVPAQSGNCFAVATYIFTTLQPEHIEFVSQLGFPGLEPYRDNVMHFLDRLDELQTLVEQHNISVITCSNGGPGQSMDFISPEARGQTIDDHVAFARDFLTRFGCEHFKINMGSRPPGGPSDDELKALADSLNELGRQTADLGIKLAPHPHIWGPVERPEEIDRIMELTDPAYVWLLPDTAHITLGGGDPVDIIERYYDRIAGIHWKDADAAYRGYTGPTPTREMHAEKILYKDLGSGGVDLKTIWDMLQARGSNHWITVDLDPPRPSEGEGSFEDKLRLNRDFLTDTLGVPHL